MHRNDEGGATAGDRWTPYRAGVRRVGQFALWVWAPGSVILIGLVMMSHVLALPTPAARSVERALVRIGAPVGTWSVYHVLYADCPCSRRVADALLRRGARDDFAERVLLVGRDQALSQRLAAARYAVEVLTSEALKEQFAVEAAPVFFAVAPDGSVPYLGGYSDFKQGPEQDDRILTSLRLGRRQDPLPVFGCAVSRELQAKADPLGLKYAVEATP